MGISSLPKFKEEMRLGDPLATSFILNYSRSFHMAKSVIQSTCNIFVFSNCHVWFGDSSLSILGNSTS
jgi:hypothetical protein